MATGTAICKCDTCGSEFTVTRSCGKRSEADSFEAWAAANYHECPDCYKERQKNGRNSQAQNLIAEFGWPEIQGASEKQTAYANNLRNQYVLKNGAELKQFYDDIKAMPDELEAYAKQAGSTVEDVIKDSLLNSDYKTAYYLSIEHSARAIIDLLK